MLTSTLDLLMSWSSSTIVPLSLLNAPRTVERPKWRTANCADECCGSICQLELAAPAGRERPVARLASIAIRERHRFILFSFLLELEFKHAFGNCYSCLSDRISSSRSYRVFRRAPAMWRNCRLCKSRMG